MEINIGDLVLENEIELGAVELDIKTEVPDIEDLTVIPTKQEQVFTHPNSYGYDEVTVEAIPQEYIIPEGTLDITENGEYNIKNYENANVNVSSNFAITNCDYLCSSNRRIDDLTNFLQICKPTSADGMFSNSSNLISVSSFDTSNNTKFSDMFAYCSNLTNIEVLNTSSASRLQNMFRSCSSLSDESLNNILLMCINSGVRWYKTLKDIGLSSQQATRCQSLSNYQAFLNAGWTTGY